MAKGPIEILCEEIKYPFEPVLEMPANLVAFARVLYSHVSDMVAWRSVISRGCTDPQWNTLEASKALEAVGKYLSGDPLQQRENRCRRLHELTSQGDDGCNRILEMLSGIVSAIRFGLEVPCHSRHAASAGEYICQLKYGFTLFDEFTSDCQKDWLRRQFKTAVTTPPDGG